jgi:thymidine phosphorylase
VLVCAAHLLVQTGRAKSLKAAHRQAEVCLDSGKPRQKWDEMLAAQGADLDDFKSKLELEGTAPVVVELKARKAGYVARCDARIIGEVVRDLGGGRVTKESVIDYDVGVDHLAKPGERISAGSVLAQIHAMDKTQGETARARLGRAFVLQSSKPKLQPLID